MLFKCRYVNNVPTVIPLANMSDNITDDASQVTITDTHGISGSVGAVTDLQTLTNTGSQKAMNNLAELMNDATAPKNYAVGDHILRNGQYSKVKQAIQQGDSFTSSNLEAACIGDEISSISSDLASVITGLSNKAFTIAALEYLDAAGSVTLSISNNAFYLLITGSYGSGRETAVSMTLITHGAIGAANIYPIKTGSVVTITASGNNNIVVSVSSQYIGIYLLKIA